MRALVIGADGAIGRGVAAALAGLGWAVTGTSRRAAPNGMAGALPLDLAALPNTALPPADILFLCAAMTRQADCRAEAGLAARVNRDAPIQLARAAAERGARVVFLSSSAVFDGREPHRRAADPPCPLNDYGRLKAEAEAGVLALPGGTVVRLTKVLHAGIPLFQGWIDALGRGERIRAFTDLRMAPIGLDDAVKALVRVAESEETGIFQVSGAHDIGYADAAQHLAQRLGCPADRVEPVSAVGIPACDRPGNTSLDAGRLVHSGHAPPPDPFEVIDRVFGLNG
jgi:dTDP-4-dehydrorhamnose reductase